MTGCARVHASGKGAGSRETGWKCVARQQEARGDRSNQREVEGIGSCWSKEARELGTVAKEETRMGVAGAECETAEGKCEPER